MDFIDGFRRDARHAVRALVRSPSFSFIAALTLALGLGATTTIFTLIDRVVLRPLPYPQSDRLIRLSTSWPKIKANEEYDISKGQYFFFKRNSAVLQDILMYDPGMLVVEADGTHAAERIAEVEVSATTFQMLGIGPEKGRLLTREDELVPDGDSRVALITHDYWQRRFGGDPNIVGKHLQTDEPTPLEIIGVLRPGASLPEVTADVWLRNHLDPNAPPQNNHTHRAIALLKPGVTIQSAAADLRRVQDRMQQTYPNVYAPAFLQRTGFSVRVSSLRDRVVGGTIVRALWLIFGAVGFVLLIAAANVANLFLVRIDARRREVAVRTALGADRRHLAAYFLTESLLLSAIAAILAVTIGYALLRVIVVLAPQTLPRLAEIRFDWRSVAFCFVMSGIVGIIFGILPLASAGLDVALLRDGGRGLTISKPRELARRGLVLAQIALAVVLLSGAALMVKSFAHLRSVRPGFDPSGVETMTVILPQRYKTYQQAETFWRTFIQRVETIRGVVRAGAVDQLPLDGDVGCSGVIVDVTNAAGESGNCMPMGIATPGFVETMGIRVQGAASTWSSLEAGTGQAIVTTAFAKRFWDGANPVGHRVTPFNLHNPPFPIVAETQDILANGLQSPPIQEVYFSLLPPPGMQQWQVGNGLILVVKAPTLNSATLVRSIRGILAQVESQALVADIRPMESVVARSMAQTSFTMLLLLIAATIALVLSAVGIYGVVSFVVGQRRGEIGIRMALGAQLSDVSRLIVGQSATLAVAGVAIGLVLALGGTRLLRSLLFDVSPNDPMVLAGTAAALLVVALLASIGPVRRAARIDPVEAMRV